ncbi:MerR family transcriptional regulator [Umezawaea endophytica]|uniref:MerR family transcriptional regulator n=1 Tax=Umezawaea endophytica TaxID=1654476 RepID=A0A9X3A4D8_9PSEU|nr:MerR family transcriptional regulator [Umezawaea endophytica]MCS7482744.1 MerR family transcriptional regulator [Umezawaea endophytica]
MRISELSRSSGVPVPTIKYYLREGLLPSGERTGRNQAAYGGEHLRRLKLVRALVDVGGLSIAAVGDVIDVLEASDVVTHQVLGVVQRSMGSDDPPEADRAAQDEVRDFLARRGWETMADDPAARSLAGVVATARKLGHHRFAAQLDAYAEASVGIARQDLDYVLLHSEVDDVLESMVIATVLGDAALVALRKLAQRDASARLLGEE